MATQERSRSSASDVLVNIILIGVLIVVGWLAWPSLITQFQARTAGAPALQAPAPIGNVGGQAPASVRGTNPDLIAPAAVVSPIPGLALNQAEADKQYQDAINAAEAVPTAAPAPLPLNSAGAPIIDAQQQMQLDQSAQMAADEAQAAQRQAANADAAGRAPDVSYDDAKALLGRDPCHVPRANPATCALGLFKPTPVN